MKLLSLLRHATASPEGADDHSRALDDKGIAEAVAIAASLQGSGLAAPDLILTSDARRTHDTALAVHAVFNHALLINESALYLAPPADILDTLMTIDDRYDHVVIVGHNPGIGQLAYDLGGHAHPHVSNGFAPATLAAFECNVATWADLRPQHLALRSVLIP